MCLLVKLILGDRKLGVHLSLHLFQLKQGLGKDFDRIGLVFFLVFCFYNFTICVFFEIFLDLCKFYLNGCFGHLSRISHTESAKKLILKSCSELLSPCLSVYLLLFFLKFFQFPSCLLSSINANPCWMTLDYLIDCLVIDMELLMQQLIFSLFGLHLLSVRPWDLMGNLSFLDKVLFRTISANLGLIPVLEFFVSFLTLNASPFVFEHRLHSLDSVGIISMQEM